MDVLVKMKRDEITMEKMVKTKMAIVLMCFFLLAAAAAAAAAAAVVVVVVARTKTG